MKIMVCYDGSKSSKKALQLSLEHAKCFKADIVVVAILEGNSQEQLNHLDQLEPLLADAKLLLSHDTAKVETRLLSENNLSTGENLVAFASEDNIKEIIIGIKKRSRVGKFFTGSTAQYVILNAECPVTTVF